MSSYLDHLPSSAREKIRKRMRSPEAYERLREKVKGPEDLEREMEKNAEFAEVKLALESEPKAQEKAREIVVAFIEEKGIEAAFDGKVSPEVIKKGHFTMAVIEKGRSQPKLAVKLPKSPQKNGEAAPSGNVAEVLSLKPALQQQIIASLRLSS